MPSNVIKLLQSEYNISPKKAEDAWKRAKDIYKEDYGKKESDFGDKDYAIITTIAKKIAGSKKENLNLYLNSKISAKEFIETMVSGDFPELKDFSDIQEPEMDWEDDEDKEKTYYSDIPVEENKIKEEEKTDEELMKSAEKMAKNALGNNASKEELDKLTKKFFDQMSEKDKMNEITEKEQSKIKINKEQTIKDSEGKEWILEVGDIVEILNEAEKWSGDVKTSWDAPEGLFAEGSAQKIADEALKGHKGDIGSAIKSINFYQNRAGVNLSDERKKTMQKAIEILQKKEEK